MVLSLQQLGVWKILETRFVGPFTKTYLTRPFVLFFLALVHPSSLLLGIYGLYDM
jgi:hypothetical protein